MGTNRTGWRVIGNSMGGMPTYVEGWRRQMWGIYIEPGCNHL